MNATAGTGPTRRYPEAALAAVALGCLVFVVFSPVLKADFVAWDDDVNLYHNPHLKGLSGETLRWLFTDLGYVWRYEPFVWVTWQSIYEVQGLAPLGYHLASVLVHALNAVWLFLVIRKLLPVALPAECRAAPRACEWVCPGLGALLWATHPLRVEPVAWAAGYLHCQSLCLMLLCVWLYLESLTAGSCTAQRWCYWLSVLSYLVSLFSFPSSLGLVPLLVILDVYPLRRFGEQPGRWWNAAARRIWLEKTPFLALALVAVGIGMLARLHPQPEWPQPISLAQFGWSARAAQACYVGAYFLWRPWAPIGLSPVYTTLIQFDPLAWPFLVSAAAVAGLTTLLVWKRRDWPWALALWAAHLVLLFPMLGLTEHPHFPSDRYSYGAGILWSMLGAGLLLKLWGQPGARRASLSVLLVIAAILGTLSVQQTRVWRNSEALFRYVISELGNDPYRSDLHRRLGLYYSQTGRLQDALAEYQAALNISPGLPEVHNNLGVTLQMRGKIIEAACEFEAVLRLQPGHVQAHNNLGLALAAQGKAAAAVAEFDQALRLKPDYPEAHSNLGKILAEQGQMVEATAQFAEAVRLKPDYADAHHNLANALFLQNKLEAAAAQYSAVLRLNPKYFDARQNLALVLEKLGRNQEAADQYAELARLRPDFAAAYHRLGVVLAKQGRFAEAIRATEDGIRLAATAGQGNLAEEMKSRLRYYRAGLTGTRED
jgi:protein O-mannosyl-transferase